MTVHRYRDVGDMPEPLPPRSALDGLASACGLSRASSLFGHMARAPRGVRKFRSIAEADAHRAEWESRRDAQEPDAEVEPSIGS